MAVKVPALEVAPTFLCHPSHVQGYAPSPLLAVVSDYPFVEVHLQFVLSIGDVVSIVLMRRSCRFRLLLRHALLTNTFPLLLLVQRWFSVCILSSVCYRLFALLAHPDRLQLDDHWHNIDVVYCPLC